VPLGGGQARGQAEEEGCRFERIDDGEKTGKRQQESADNRVHFAGARNTLLLSPFQIPSGFRTAPNSMDGNYFIVTGSGAA